MMEAVRALGFAARFVSGYLYVPARDRRAATSAAARTHAWVQVYLPGAGWVEFDPTNGIVGNRDLIRVAVARDPRQAVPLSGTWTGFPPTTSAWTSRWTSEPRDRAACGGTTLDAAAPYVGGSEVASQRSPHADPRRLRDRLRLPGADADAAAAQRPSVAARRSC